jgi:segregation and condensation protein A
VNQGFVEFIDANKNWLPLFATVFKYRVFKGFPVNYEIKLPQFEGPFDLLLFFIERDELDIYDIPISTITDDFLAYLHHLQQMNLEVASEFILVAATLMRIKAKMLLPRKEVDEEGNEIDPRQELVDRLLEYKRYKSVVEEFQKLEAIRQSMVPRGNVLQEINLIIDQYSTDAEMESLSQFRLIPGR